MSSPIRRNYFDVADVATATDAQAALAEAMLDEYVGYQPPSVPMVHFGQVTSYNASTKVLADTSNTTQIFLQDDFFDGCVIEIIGGTGKGQQVVNVVGSSRVDKSLTLKTALATPPDTTSIFRVYQLAKFPRSDDVYNGPTGTRFYKYIPDEVREAAKAQCAFIVAKGDSFFVGDSTDMQSESFLSYSYNRGTTNQGSLAKLIAPKARSILRGIKNPHGSITVGEETEAY